jgi:hypothetical protein
MGNRCEREHCAKRKRHAEQVSLNHSEDPLAQALSDSSHNSNAGAILCLEYEAIRQTRVSTEARQLKDYLRDSAERMSGSLTATVEGSFIPACETYARSKVAFMITSLLVSSRRPRGG